MRILYIIAVYEEIPPERDSEGKSLCSNEALALELISRLRPILSLNLPGFLDR